MGAQLSIFLDMDSFGSRKHTVSLGLRQKVLIVNSHNLCRLYIEECKSGYIARGGLCYKMMTKRPWRDANCPEGNEFMSAEDEDENRFIYEKFVKPLRKSIWMNSRVCKKGKLCARDSTTHLYQNFVGQFPANGCVKMRYEENGMWVSESCEAVFSYVCKYGQYKMQIRKTFITSYSKIIKYKSRDILRLLLLQLNDDRVDH